MTAIAPALSYEFDEAKAALQSAITLHDAGNFSAAVPFYIRAVTLAPNDPDVLHASGIALGQAGKPVEAIKHLTAALALGKNTADVWNALGMAYIDTRKLGNAERCFRQVVTRHPNGASGWVNFGNFAYAGGDSFVESIEDAKWVVCATVGGVKPELVARLRAAARSGLRVTIGPRVPARDGSMRAMATAKSGCEHRCNRTCWSTTRDWAALHCIDERVLTAGVRYAS